MKKSENGFSTIECMAAASILLLAVVSILQVISFTYTALERQKIIAARTRIADNLTNISGMAASLRAALRNHPENGDLGVCIYGSAQGFTEGGKTHHHYNNGGAAAWTKCLNDGVYRATRLYLPMIDVAGNVIKTSGALTGTPSLPVRYNSKGQLCDMAERDCPAADWPIETFTEFAAICPPIFDPMYDDDLRGGKAYYGPVYPAGLVLGTQCDYARYVKIKLTIQQSVDKTATSNKTSIANFKTIVSVLPVDSALVRAAM